MALSQPQLVHVDDRVLKDRAHALIQEGKLEAAADLYVQLIAQNNKDPSLRLHHAELCEKLHRKDRAVAAYQLDDNVIAFTHTLVPKALEGRGIGSRLIRAALDSARDRGLKVRPMCAFVAAYVVRHPEYRDLLA